MDTVPIDSLKHEVKIRLDENPHPAHEGIIELLTMACKQKYGDRIKAIAATQYVNFVTETIQNAEKIYNEMAAKYPLSGDEGMFERT